MSGEDEEEAARSKARKRVRFQDDVAAAAPSERGEPDGGCGTSCCLPVFQEPWLEILH